MADPLSLWRGVGFRYRWERLCDCLVLAMPESGVNLALACLLAWGVLVFVGTVCWAWWHARFSHTIVQEIENNQTPHYAHAWATGLLVAWVYVAWRRGCFLERQRRLAELERHADQALQAADPHFHHELTA